ncbi:MAG: hypothetical protein ACOZAN_00055 [Patescibacteria group bacterium]
MESQPNQERSGSNARQYLEGLIQAGDVYATPGRLRDKSVGWSFHLETGELTGYKATGGSNRASVNFDRINSSIKGMYIIAYIGPVPRVVFQGKVGTTGQGVTFTIIRNANNTRFIAFVNTA